MRTSFAALALVAAASVAQGATFNDDFNGSGGPSGSWEVAKWANGSPFGCTFAATEAWVSNGQLSLNINDQQANAIKCAEIRTYQSFTYGKFIVRMQPSSIAGTDSSFFLYTGTAGTSSHFEIDIEFLNGGRTLHTNVWKQGQQNYQQFSMGGGFMTVGFEWRSNYVRWFTVNGNGQESEIRRVSTSISQPMRLMLNHWNGDNSASAKNFVGQYNRGGGAAKYDWVKVSN